jgi:hypothetical protein
MPRHHLSRGHESEILQSLPALSQLSLLGCIPSFSLTSQPGHLIALVLLGFAVLSRRFRSLRRLFMAGFKCGLSAGTLLFDGPIC